MIKCYRLDIDGVLLFEHTINKDSRGTFCEVYKQDKFLRCLPENIRFVQDNESVSKYGVLRGLHFQFEPYAQSKLVRVSYGEIQDVVVDIRKESPTFGHHLSVKLSKENGKQLFVPRGFAHGFLSLSNYSIVNYKVDNYYSKENESGILFNDSDLGIKWDIDSSNIIVGDKDLKYTKLNEANLL